MPQLVSVNDLYLKIMPFGPPGSGKTTWACTAQDHAALSFVLVIDSDDGLLSVAARGDIEAERCTSLEQYETILGRLVTGDPVFAKFKTIITDSGSDLLDRGLREEAMRNFQKAAGQGEAGKGGKKSFRNSPDELFQRDYGIVTNRMKRLFNTMRSLPRHVIITSLAAERYPVIGKDENGQDKIGPEPDSIHPAFTAKLGMGVRGMMDFVWYFRRKVEETGSTFTFLTMEVGPYKCKSRGSKFPEALGRLSTLSLPEVYDLLVKTERG